MRTDRTVWVYLHQHHLYFMHFLFLPCQSKESYCSLQNIIPEGRFLESYYLIPDILLVTNKYRCKDDNWNLMSSTLCVCTSAFLCG